MFGNEHSGNRGGTPLFWKFRKLSKMSKICLPGSPGGALGDTFLTSWTPADRIQAAGGGEGGGPPLAAQTDVKPALWVYRPVQEHYGSSHTHTN